MTSLSRNSTGDQPELVTDRRKALKEFDDTKLGVKGLVDLGITHIPSIFHHPPENLIHLGQSEPDPGVDPIPVIDLSSPISEVVDQVREAAKKFGFFQLINHGVPVYVLDRLLNAVKDFHDLPSEERMKHYRREMGTGFSYLSNRDLFLSKAASWRDTLSIPLGLTPDFDAIPAVCRNEIIEWNKEVKKLGETLLGLLSQGLGMKADKLKEMSCSENRTMGVQYYPYCPEPNKTVGIPCHSDPGVLTVLLQDQLGGLQVKHNGKWIDVKPIHGALVINVGDFLQIISNDKYTSVEHRVCANPLYIPRTSIAVFFAPSVMDKLYGPLPEVVSPEEPALYQQFSYMDFMDRFFNGELDGKSLIKYFSLETK